MAEVKAMMTGSSAQNLSEKNAKKVGTKIGPLSVKELAPILGITRRAVLKRSERENWPFVVVSSNGGPQKLFRIDDLPSDITKMIRVHFNEVPAELAECVPSDFDQARIARCSRAWDAAEPWQRERARDRKAILDALDWFQRQEGTLRTAVDRFVKLFQDHDVPGLEPQIYQRIRRISRSQLYEWKNSFERDGLSGLMSRHGSNRGEMRIPQEQCEFILGVWADKPHLKASRIARSLAARFNGTAVSARQVQKFLRTRRKEDPQTFAFLEAPDGWRSRFMLALGNASEKAEHFLHWVEVDSTLADVMCKDNRRYAVLGLIDVFSRKCKFLLCPTSNSWGIAGLMRATCLDWGIPENLVRDNGQDYASDMTNGGLESLGVNVRAARPFNPQEKPHIERVFGTMCRDLFEVQPGYVGHNVGERKKIEDRKSFAARINGRRCIQLGLTAAELQERIDGWIEQEYHQRDHSGICRVSPNARASSVPYRPRRIEDPRALDILLARPGRGGREPTRVVLKDGLHFETGLYWGDCLIDWIGRQVAIRLDLKDAGRLFCFDPKSKSFIGDARDMALSGMTVGEKIAARKRAAKTVREKAKAMRIMAQKVGDPFAEELHKAKERARLRNLPVGEPVKGNPFIDAAMQAADMVREEEEEAARAAESRPAVRERVLAEPEDLDPKVALFKRKEPTSKQDLVFKNERTRFDYLRHEQRMRELTGEEIRWILTNLSLPALQRHIHMFSQDWEECDRIWLGLVAPTYFPQFVTKVTGEIR